MADDFNVFVMFDGKGGSYQRAFRQDQLKVVSIPQTARRGEPTRKHPARGQTPSVGGETNAQLKVGDQLRVVAHDDKYDGKVGVIAEITDEAHGYNVHVAFKDGSRRRCRRDALKIVRAGPQTAISSKPTPKSTALHQSPDNGEDSVTGGLKVGDAVQVVARDHKYDGKIGVIKKITNEDHGYNMHVNLEGGSYQATFRSDQLKLVGAAGAPLGGSDETRQLPHGMSGQGQVSYTAPTAHLETNTTRPALKVGDRVQVADREDRCDGRVGIIQEIKKEDHGYNIHVDLEGDFYRRAFRSDQLKLVGGAAQQPASQKSPQHAVPTQGPGWYPHPTDPHAQLYWDGYRWTHENRRKLNTRRILLIVGAAIAAVIIVVAISAIATQGFRDMRSYNLGHNAGLQDKSSRYPAGCLTMLTLAHLSTDAPGLVDDDFLAGCNDAER